MRPQQEFGADITNQANNEAEVSPAMMICTRLAGRAIIRVVGRCNDAQENCNLGERSVLCKTLCVVFCACIVEKIKIKNFLCSEN